MDLFTAKESLRQSHSQLWKITAFVFDSVASFFFPTQGAPWWFEEWTNYSGMKRNFQSFGPNTKPIFIYTVPTIRHISKKGLLIQCDSSGCNIEYKLFSVNNLMFTLTLRYLIMSCHWREKNITVLAKAHLTKNRTVFPLFECSKHISYLREDLPDSKL